MTELDFVKNISTFVANQFPDFYRVEGETLVAFTKAYYEFLESDPIYSHKIGRQMFDIHDIDTSLSQFITNFKNTYLVDFPNNTSIDKKLLIKHISSFYKTKGSKRSLELLMQILFNEQVEIYLPAQDVLKTSDSEWFTPIYLEVTLSSKTPTWIGKQITGSKSGASAFVENVIRKRVNGKISDVIFLSSVSGTFIAGELLSDTTNYRNSPKVKGSLNNITLSLGGRNNKVGDLFNVVSSQGIQGVAKVVETVNSTGRVDFTIEDGGWGFTNTDITSVYVANAMIFVENSNTDFIMGETVYQPLETLRLDSAADILSSNTLVGSYIVGKLGSLVVANGVIVSASNTDIDGTVISEPSTFGTLKVLTDFGTFAEQKSITFTANTGFAKGEYIDEESDITLDYTNIVGGTFTVGNRIEQVVNEFVGTQIPALTTTLTAGNATITLDSTLGLVAGQTLTKTSGTGEFAAGTTILQVLSSTQLKLNKAPTVTGAVEFTANQVEIFKSYAFGTIYAANSTAVDVDRAWGSFEASGTYLMKEYTPAKVATGVSAVITKKTTNTFGARALVTSTTGNTAVCEITYGAFTPGKLVLSDKTNLLRTISTVTDSGASIAYLNGVSSANGIIREGRNTYVEGIVVGQDEVSVGVYGNESPFLFSTTNAYSSYIMTRREDMVFPPLDSSNNIINVTKQITRIAGGTGASFEVGAIEAVEEDVVLYTDVTGEENVSGVSYLDIKLTGENSGFGFVAGVNVVNGGTGYSNSAATVVFTGGGFADGDPIGIATGTLVTDSTGAITRVYMNYNGSGYYTTPIIEPPEFGNGAVLEPIMNYGYGFPKNPNAEYNNLIGDCLSTTVEDLGKIAVLSRVNPGAGYTASPFVYIKNQLVSGLNRRDMILYVNNKTGVFRPGEYIEQTISGTTSVKGLLVAEAVSNGYTLLYVDRQSLSVSFDYDYPVTGSVSGASATLVNAIVNKAQPQIGNNAVINATTINAEGVATKIEVVDSGFGYISDEGVTLQSVDPEFPYIMTGTTRARNQGKGRGYWKTTSSHLNSEKVIQDSDYYQEYSYEIQTGISLNKYEQVIRDVFHVAGNNLFGAVIKTSFIDLSTDVEYSAVIEIE